MDTCDFCDQSGREAPQTTMADVPELQLQDFMDYRLMKAIAREVPILARRLGADLAAYVQQTTAGSVYDHWRAGKLACLNGAMTGVENACRSIQLRHVMQDMPMVDGTVRHWAQHLANAAASDYFGRDLKLTLPDTADSHFPEISLDVSAALPSSATVRSALMRIYTPVCLRNLVRRSWFIHIMTGRQKELTRGIIGCMISAGNVQHLSRGLALAFTGQLRQKMDEICALQEGKTCDTDGSENTKTADQGHWRQQ